MEQLQSLLNKLSKELSRENTKLEEKKSRGESFNIFSICGVNHYEVTHSAIIAEFLDPQGSHGQGLAFVKAFIESLNLQDFDFSLNGVEVATEMVTPNGRIDVVISNNNKQAVIIENKIYASDQWKQLKRYDDFAKTKYTNGYKILYLTLNGNDPNDEGSKKVDYVTISYKHHIIDWLLRCKHLAIDKPLIRETLNQYIQHIKNLTNTIDMDTDNKNSIIKLLIEIDNYCFLSCNGIPFLDVMLSKIYKKIYEVFVNSNPSSEKIKKMETIIFEDLYMYEKFKINGKKLVKKRNDK